ncbi:hypothetical protein E1B28_006439 [Marasmius oreades]|uniref:Uncharacterized protein n=1 Tax=Marasmius oreades TaxID=181124 RepID=A0A9P7S5E7_9AGAR|nr:uncharacterized protein E1B28_006439 [Marasmius oreades]KAG7095729.1 hypothetical protein E1B28_006439 [Marasmius oreades]
MDSYSEIASLDSFTGTETSRSTVPGLGYLSGKATKRLGEAVLNGVDYLVVNRQLNRVEARIRKDGSLDKHEAEGRDMCSILLELTHPGYSFPVQTKALRLIMEQIGSMSFKSLAAALVVMNSSFTTHRHLLTIIECLWSSRRIGVSSDTATIRDSMTTKKITACQAAGYEAYMAVFTNSNDMSVLSSSSAFILYLAFIIAIGSKDHARIIFSLDISRFLEAIGLFDPLRSRSETIAGRLLLHVIALKLDPIQDADAVASIENNISTLKMSRSNPSNSRPKLDPIQYADAVASVEKIISTLTKSPSNPSNSSSTNDDMEDLWKRLENWYTVASSQRSPLIDVVSDAIVFIRDDTLFRNMQPRVMDPPKDVKVLLLGSSECGKTTIMKQLILSHRGSEQFTSQFSDKVMYAWDLAKGVVFPLEGLMEKQLGYALEWDWGLVDIRVLMRVLSIAVLSIADLKMLMSSIRARTRDLASLQSLADENLSYRLSVLKRIEELPSSEYESYAPTEEDLVRWYIKTTGPYEETFETATRNYHVWDCGGQRIERKKWIHCFQDVSVMLYIASLTDYDQVLREDGEYNQMKESLLVFDSLCQSKWFKITPIILVLTKRDCLTNQKLSLSPLEDYFPDYTGGPDENAAFEYIKGMFLQLCQDRAGVSVHVMNPNSAEEVKTLFKRIDEALDSSSSKRKLSARRKEFQRWRG